MSKSRIELVLPSRRIDIGMHEGATRINSNLGAAGSGIGGYVAGSTAGAFAQNLVGGLFGKKKKADAASASTPISASTPTPSGPQPGAPEAGMFTVAEVSMETTAIDPAPVSAEQFESQRVGKS